MSSTHYGLTLILSFIAEIRQLLLVWINCASCPEFELKPLLVSSYLELMIFCYLFYSYEHRL